MASRSKEYYDSHPEAARKKRAYQRKYKKTKKGKISQRKVAEANRENRRRGTYGNGDGLDYDHATGKLEPQSKNRGRAEGPRKKGSKRARRTAKRKARNKKK